MLDNEQDSQTRGRAAAPEAGRPDESASESGAPPPPYEESILEEVGTLIDDAKLYAVAELAFQKTRARIVGKSLGVAVFAVILALILLHIALIAMAVGFVIALAPFVTIWGAIAIVVGVMLLGVGALAYLALSKGRQIARTFDRVGAAPEPDGAEQ